jgi:hypothetical protein
MLIFIPREESSAGATDEQALLLPHVVEQHSSQAYERDPDVCEGSLGVRGLIQNLRVDSLEGAVSDLHRILDTFKENGVGRVHLLLTPASTGNFSVGFMRIAAERCGFYECPGEKLFTRYLEARPQHETSIPHEYTPRDGSRADIEAIGSILAREPELEVKPWEFPLIIESLERQDRFFKVVEYAGDVVGVSIGGSDAERGTITHTWVHRDHRWSPVKTDHPRLGKWLSDESLIALYDGGARYVHLMTVPKNPGADAFWAKQGFRLEPEGSFVEITL